MTWATVLIVGLLPFGQLDPLTHVGSLTDGLGSPARATVTPGDVLLVTDPVNDVIARFDVSVEPPTFVGTWSVPGGPLGIAVHPDPADGRYFISLRDEGKVAIYDYDDVNDLISFSGDYLDGNGAVTFGRPTDIAIGSNADAGNPYIIYVVDAEGDKVYGFNESDGEVALIFGERGTAIGQFKYPSAIAVYENGGSGNKLVVADQDNFRVQVFSSGGAFLQKFGYRIKYVSGGGQEGWMPRTQGLAVDSAGRMYVADAFMGTVRVFDNMGTELGKVIEYGDIRVPCDLVLSNDELRLYVVSTNSSSVEIYDTPTLLASLEQNGSPAQQAVPALGMGGIQVAPLIPIWWPDAPEFSLRDVPGYSGPHILEGAPLCERCHATPGQPGGYEGSVEGQAVLCMSCHSAGGQAMEEPIHEMDPADPYVLALGTSHAWGVPAVNASAGSDGPTPGSDIDDYLDDGNIKCATCHEQHNSDAGSPYLRAQNNFDQMCRDCHTPRDKGLYEDDPVNNRGTHPVNIDYEDEPDEFTPAGSLVNVILKSGRVECMSCHAPHYATSGGANGGLGDGNLLRTANDSTLCTSCHNGPLAPQIHGSVFPQDCTVCHSAHTGSDNLYLIRDDVQLQVRGAVPVVFTDDSVGVGPGAFVDPDPAVDGICEACHAYPPADPDLVPEHTMDMPACTNCHQHHNAFEPGLGPLPAGEYVGADTCALCHADYHAEWSGTLHPEAWDTLNAIGQGANASCLPCHTVGFGEPSGFVDDATTPQLEGVQCENCHDAASAHVSDPLAVQPTIDRSAALCGTCHTGTHQPTYDEWLTSAHAVSSADSHTSSCNVCHAPLGEQGNPPALLNVDCVACHDPHAQTGNAADPEPGHDYQLLYTEVASPTPSNTVADATNPDRFNLCGQCHHSRGTVWTATSRGPHHSLQANVYLGEMPVPDGIDLVPFTASDHAGIELQCVKCHMYKAPHENGPPEVAAITGHSWEINYEACAECHTSAEAAQALAEGTQGVVHARLDAILAALGDPATWEYSSGGGPPAGPGGQDDIPDDIKKARFLYYYLENDGSFGVHNASYADAILDAAEALLGITPPAATYVTDDVCEACHADYHSDWSGTLHAGAWDSLDAIGQGANAACLPCHTVGFGEPSGFVDDATTPQLEGVQCENCHEAASEHIANPHVVQPTIDRSAALCGTCHTGTHQPTYDEWLTSGHAVSSEDSHSSSCNACHAPLGEQGDPPALLNVDCVACHNPHAQTGNAADPDPGRDYQLLYTEVASPTPSNTVADATDPNRFNLCGQCHHSRGKVWTATDRGPHHSLQANVYLGEMPVPDGTDLVPFTASEHVGVPVQCATCHMYTAPHEDGPPEVPAITGHSWQINFEACTGCHTDAETDLTNLQAEVQAGLDDIASRLGDPSTWDYSCCGGPPEGSPGQDDLPDEIKQVRFLYYYVLNDGSLGGHNPAYVRAILAEADAILTGIGYSPARSTAGAPSQRFGNPENGGALQVRSRGRL